MDAHEIPLNRKAYARWWFAMEAATSAYFKETTGDEEDLGDFVESMSTMHSFGPNPRTFDPPITPEEV